MKTALRTLLEGVIDYAGLFPPASLPLEQVVRNYAAYCGSHDRWMLRHLVIPAGQLAELAALSEVRSDPAQPWTLSVLGSRCTTTTLWQDTLLSDLKAMEEFPSDAATIAALELPLPNEADVHIVGDLIDRSLQCVRDSSLSVGEMFIEVTPSEMAASIRQAAAERIGGLAAGSMAVGVKLRTGGMDASAFPSAAELATFIAICQQNGLRWKATAGLHHLSPREDAEIGTVMHGFLNVLVAATMAHSHSLDVDALSDILCEPDAAEFGFTDQSLSWRGHAATLAQIQQARRKFVSFGSCSFDDPRVELAEVFAFDTAEVHAQDRGALAAGDDSNAL